MDMSTQMNPEGDLFGHLAPREKREQLRNMSELVWDVEEKLAQIKADRARLMISLQQDLGRRAS